MCLVMTNVDSFSVIVNKIFCWLGVLYLVQIFLSDSEPSGHICTWYIGSQLKFCKYWIWFFHKFNNPMTIKIYKCYGSCISVASAHFWSDMILMFLVRIKRILQSLEHVSKHSLWDDSQMPASFRIYEKVLETNLWLMPAVMTGSNCQSRPWNGDKTSKFYTLRLTQHGWHFLDYILKYICFKEKFGKLSYRSLLLRIQFTITHHWFRWQKFWSIELISPNPPTHPPHTHPPTTHTETHTNQLNLLQTLNWLGFFHQYQYHLWTKLHIIPKNNGQHSFSIYEISK